MNYQIQVTDAELNLIGAALMRIPNEQLALIDKLRRRRCGRSARRRPAPRPARPTAGRKVLDGSQDAVEVPTTIGTAAAA